MTKQTPIPHKDDKNIEVVCILTSRRVQQMQNYKKATPRESFTKYAIHFLKKVIKTKKILTDRVRRRRDQSLLHLLHQTV